MYQDRRRDFPGESALQARRRVGELLDIKPETLRGWIERVEIDAGQRPGVPSSVDARIKDLERENVELRRGERDPQDRFGVFRRGPSSTADCADRRLHRRVSGPLRGRADLSGAHRARPANRPEHLLRPPDRRTQAERATPIGPHAAAPPSPSRCINRRPFVGREPNESVLIR